MTDLMFFDIDDLVSGLLEIVLLGSVDSSKFCSPSNKAYLNAGSAIITTVMLSKLS